MFAARKTDGAGTAAAASYIEDVFSTYLYTGNGAAQTIPNGIALGSAYGGSVYFDGTDDYLRNTSVGSALQTGTGNFTIEFWFKGGTQVPYAVIFELYVNGGSGQRLAIQAGSPANSCIYVEGGNIRITTAANPFDNLWHHHAIVRDGSTVTYYIDGVSNGTYTTSLDLTTGDSFIIGAYSVTLGFNINGQLSNFRFVKGTAVYTSAFTPPTAPLTAITNTQLLTCQTPNTVLDYSSNAFPITVTNAVAQNGGGPFTDSTANKGGMVWLKSRSAAGDHALYDTNRGATFDLVSNSTAAQTTQTTGLTSFNGNGFSIGSLAKLNTSAATYASWTFRKQAKFFDVVTYTGTGSAQTINHNLGSVPGCIIIKCFSSAADWAVYHRGLTNAATTGIYLNSTDAAFSVGSAWWNSTAPTSTQFSVGTSGNTNNNGATYVAYLFAHDAGGFGAAGTDNVISCGSYLGSNHRAQEVVQLGYEPQFVMIKNITTVQPWVLVDNMRNMSRSGNNAWLTPNSTAAETAITSDRVVADARGFYFDGAQAPINQAGSTFIYIAIRRGPMKTPTSGTSVFSTSTSSAMTGTITSGFPTDFVMALDRTVGTSPFNRGFSDRLRGAFLTLSSALTDAENANSSTISFNSNTGAVLNGGSVYQNGYVYEQFRRAPGFMDVVCYSGDGTSNRNVTHGLGASPELIILKQRSGTFSWRVWHKDLTSGRSLYINNTDAETVDGDRVSGASSTTFTLTTNHGSINASGSTYVAYLFGTVTGVSKVGSYTGNGSNQTINCGFTAGARFILIKRISSTGDWYVWDTARGIVSGNDPRLSLNSTAAEVTTDDSIDPDNSGFIVNQLSATNINVSSATYIYLAIA